MIYIHNCQQGRIQDGEFGENAPPQFLISTEAYLDNVFQFVASLYTI